MIELGGVPAGCLDYACRLAEAGARAVGCSVSRGAVAAHLMLPLTTGAPRPPAPRPFGKGFVSCELGGGDDAEDFERLLSVTGARTPHQLAVAAQEWRLPVVDYRARCTAARPVLWTVEPPLPAQPSTKPARRGLEGVTVVDLTAMWSGPLATALLQSLGARVRKVEPDVRLDGLRGTPPMHAALNDGKERLPLDLRHQADREAFFEAVAGADVVIDNFSPRVMPNLGLDHRALAAVNPKIITVSMPAFPEGSPERAWVAYGTGAHAAAGLGDVGERRMVSPAVSYPDPLAGFAAFATIASWLAAGGPAHAEVTLAGAVAPLLEFPPGRTLEADPTVVDDPPWPVFS